MIGKKKINKKRKMAINTRNSLRDLHDTFISECKQVIQKGSIYKNITNACKRLEIQNENYNNLPYNFQLNSLNEKNSV